MDRNTFWGLFLILIILVGSTFLMKPSEEELKKEQLVQDSIARATNGNKQHPKAVQLPASTKTVVADTTTFKGPFASLRKGSNTPIVLENELIRVIISPKGGRVSAVELKEFKDFAGKPLIQFEGNDNKFGFDLRSSGTTVSTNELYFTPSDSSFTVSQSDSKTIRLRLQTDENSYLEYVYTLSGKSYKLGLTITSVGLQQFALNQQKLILDWESQLHQKEKDLASEQRYSTAYYKVADETPDHLSVAKDDTKELNEGKIEWISFKQHYFSNVLIAKNGFAKGSVSVSTQTQPGVVKGFKAQLDIPLNSSSETSVPLEFYFGPNKFSTLQAQGYDLQKQIDLGWGPLKYINRFVVVPVFTFLSGFNWSYGLIILVLTILLKVVLFPLTYKSYLSMAKMRILKPEMDEIKAKVGEDNATLLQQEYLKLYKKAGVNPLGGCLPMILQLPIIMAFFFFFPNLFELRHQSFLWMSDLSTYDAFFQFGFKLPFLGNHISLMCILMTISTLIYTYFNNQVSGATGQMKYIGYITPIIFFGVLNSYPSGLNYYYFLANLLTFGQQFMIRQFVDDSKIHAQIQENKKKPEGAKEKKSKFQQRMEDYMRQQQQGKK
ncbi:MAG: membrane protein insertase YidC [Sphingobacteriaceae bacterium]